MMIGDNNLTRRHGIKVESCVSVEECSLAVGEIVGHENVVSASRMYKAIVLFLNSIERANEVIQRGVVIRDSLTPVLPLSGSSQKIIVSNVPPFITDEHIVRKLSPFGKVVSSVRKIHVGCKSPLLKHLLSFRRQVFMVLKNELKNELNETIKFNVDGFVYVGFVSSDATMKCFGCGEIGHLIRDCPKEGTKAANQRDTQAEAAAAAAVSPASDSDTPCSPVTVPPSTDSTVAAAPTSQPAAEVSCTEGPSLTGPIAADREVPVGLLIVLKSDADQPIELDKRADVTEMETGAPSKGATKRRPEITQGTQNKARKEESGQSEPPRTGDSVVEVVNNKFKTRHILVDEKGRKYRVPYRDRFWC